MFSVHIHTAFRCCFFLLSAFKSPLKVHGLNIPIFFQVSTLVQVVGIIICLHAATRISHRAQGVVSLASRWHAIATCASSDTSQSRSTSAGSFDTANHLRSIHIDYSESDLESLDFGGMAVNTQLVSYMSSHHRRQAFGT